jgi:predicted transcriptional regulator YdeE
MSEFLSIFGIFILGFILGWVLREELAKRRVDYIMSKLEENLEQIAEDLIQIKIERHSGQYYVFDKETDEFMAQATTREELEDSLAKRYPEKRFAATPENLKEVGFAK